MGLRTLSSHRCTVHAVWGQWGYGVLIDKTTIIGILGPFRVITVHPWLAVNGKFIYFARRRK